MKIAFLIILLCSVIISSDGLKNKTAEGRIVGGYPSTSFTREDWVGQLLSIRGEFSLRCSATLLRKCWSITSASCVYGQEQSELHVRFGQSFLSDTILRSEIIGIHQIYIDPQYLEDDRQQNIALLQLESCVQFSNRIQPITLPSIDSKVAIGSTCFVSGWGTQSESSNTPSSILLETTVPVISNEQCQSWYSVDTNVIINSNEVCAGYKAGGRGFCNGDIGSPLTCEAGGIYILQGIASHSVGCGDENRPGIYTRIASFRNWIDQTIENGVSSVSNRSVKYWMCLSLAGIFYINLQ